MTINVSKIILPLFFLALSHGAGAQSPLDTLYANATENVALFFPSGIKRAVTGSSDFIFSYDREVAGPLGLLQGVGGSESNLLVITVDGNVYAFFVKGTHGRVTSVHFVREMDRVGREWPQKLPARAKDTSYAAACVELLERKPKIRATQRKGGLRFRLEDVVHDRDVVYLVLGMRNRSGIDFEVGHLEVLQVNGSKKRRASHQETSMTPLYVHGQDAMVRNGEGDRFVVVVPKFVLGDREHLKLVLRESRGNRRLVVAMDRGGPLGPDIR